MSLDFFFGLFAGWTLGVAAAYEIVKRHLPDDFDLPKDVSKIPVL